MTTAIFEQWINWYDKKPWGIKVLLALPFAIIMVAAVAGVAMSVVFGRKDRGASSPSPITETRKGYERDLEDERRRTELMIKKMEEEATALEAQREDLRKRTENAHENIDAAIDFDAVDRARSSER